MAPRQRLLLATLFWVGRDVKSEPLLKPGVPHGYPRFESLSLRFGRTLQNAVFFHETPRLPRVSLRLWASVLAHVLRPVRALQECKKGKTVTIRGKLNGTNTGTSAPLTAPFFERFWGSTGWRNRCMAVLPGMPATVQLMCCRNHAASERKACCFIADIDDSRLTCEVLVLRIFR